MHMQISRTQCASTASTPSPPRSTLPARARAGGAQSAAAPPEFSTLLRRADPGARGGESTSVGTGGRCQMEMAGINNQGSHRSPGTLRAWVCSCTAAFAVVGGIVSISGSRICIVLKWKCWVFVRGTAYLGWRIQRAPVGLRTARAHAVIVARRDPRSILDIECPACARRKVGKWRDNERGKWCKGGGGRGYIRSPAQERDACSGAWWRKQWAERGATCKRGLSGSCRRRQIAEAAGVDRSEAAGARSRTGRRDRRRRRRRMPRTKSITQPANEIKIDITSAHHGRGRKTREQRGVGSGGGWGLQKGGWGQKAGWGRRGRWVAGVGRRVDSVDVSALFGDVHTSKVESRHPRAAVPSIPDATGNPRKKVGLGVASGRGFRALGISDGKGRFGSGSDGSVQRSEGFEPPN
ncbi:hypothetical protein C8F04DRAFT_1191264 [Mycena alexandri]|uniref:Uncharacterized protein n=1 Tax=Mycena alexandri TaxID=1745969 RepID=A0AAD6WW92_9AGAR|nr:hypothetical protein C8F04DRAFT_1191264 [Mycena alexandri]